MRVSDVACTSVATSTILRAADLELPAAGIQSIGSVQSSIHPSPLSIIMTVPSIQKTRHRQLAPTNKSYYML